MLFLIVCWSPWYLHLYTLPLYFNSGQSNIELLTLCRLFSLRTASVVICWFWNYIRNRTNRQMESSCRNLIVYLKSTLLQWEPAMTELPMTGRHSYDASSQSRGYHFTALSYDGVAPSEVREMERAAEHPIWERQENGSVSTGVEKYRYHWHIMVVEDLLHIRWFY